MLYKTKSKKRTKKEEKEEQQKIGVKYIKGIKKQLKNENAD